MLILMLYDLNSINHPNLMGARRSCGQYINRRDVLSKALFSSFEFCADGFVDDTDDGQTFNFGRNVL